ncbi:MAG TPA: hypothetical protein VHO04_14620 [Sphingopyxis sp.]|uniref:hypothetical protein n=1 Tax=Sphingopyxis sp. TaxID=1908224 RepID=UPI002E334641|nr:hypothetical protein [Sphingopyxis sp.]HEX2813906.1 hypothetical protein [Sphingopyxis sp.]
MTDAAPPASKAADHGFSPWLTPVRIALIVWAAMSLIAIVARWHAIATLELSDTDDAMRMAQVRDLLAGQGWWDLTQYRVNPAGGGVLMHWSRIVDAPLAFGILLLKPLLGQTLAEQVVMTLWPPLLGAALSVACVRGYRHLSDRRIAYVVPLYLVAAAFIVIQLRPLRVDHHGWQIFLAMLIMGQALRPASGRAGMIAGLSAAALLAISIEGLPIAALFAALAALRWALHARADDRARLTGYLGGLAGGAVFFQFLTRGPAGLAGHWCDSLSAPYIAAFAAAAAAVFAIGRVDPTRRWLRFAALGGAGALAAGTLVLVEPLCAAGPFATLDPIVVQYWYRNVLEGQPVWASPANTMLLVIVPSIVGLAGSWLAWRVSVSVEDRRNWATVIIALLGATLLSLLVLRASGTAQLFALPGCAWLGLRIWTRARSITALLPRVAVSAAAALSLPLLGGIAVVAIAGLVFPAVKAEQNRQEKSVSERTCINPATIAALDRLPPKVLLTPIDLGAPLIFWTHHSVVATPHHRNREAMADTLRIFIGDPAKAEALVRKQKATLVVYCPGANDFSQYRRVSKASLAARLYAGTPPAWLERVALPGDTGLAVWRVKPAG